MTETRKINMREYETIEKNSLAKWVKPLCAYYLTKEESGDYYTKVRVNYLFYALVVIPLHLIKAIYLMWDGGLKEFEIEKPTVGYQYYSTGSTKWEKANEIWKNA